MSDLLETAIEAFIWFIMPYAFYLGFGFHSGLIYVLCMGLVILSRIATKLRDIQMEIKYGRK